MELSQNGIDFIIAQEGVKLVAYQDSIGKWTIAVGCTIYPNGKPVQKGDTCTTDQAIEYLKHDTSWAVKAINELVTSIINNNKFDALVSFTFNLGRGNFTTSTLRKKVNANPNDPQIKNEFTKWNRAGGVVVPGIAARRSREAALYFS